MQKVKDRISCIATSKGLVYIDSPFLSDDAKKWAESTRSETGKAPAYVINTDHHYDPVMGNIFLDADIICQTTAAKNMGYLKDKKVLKEAIKDAFPDVVQKYEADIDRFDPVMPHISFDKVLTLDMGDAVFRLEFAGGHSPATIMIYLVEERFTGGNVEGQFHISGSRILPSG